MRTYNIIDNNQNNNLVAAYPTKDLAVKAYNKYVADNFIDPTDTRIDNVEIKESWETLNIIYQVKKGNKWVTDYPEKCETNIHNIYERLAKDLIAAKLEGCGYIKSIKRIQNYNGTKDIIVTYQCDSGSVPTRNIYTIESH